MAVGDLARLMVVQVVNADPIASFFGFRAKTGASTWRAGLVTEWVAFVDDLWRSLQSNRCSDLEFVVDDVVPGTALPLIVPAAPFQDGTAGFNEAGLQVAALYSWRSALQGRSNRGRTYQGGLDTSCINAGRQLQSFAQDLRIATADAIISTWGPAGSSANAEFVVISRQENGVVRPVPIGVPIVEYVLPPILGTQRKRMPE